MYKCQIFFSNNKHYLTVALEYFNKGANMKAVKFFSFSGHYSFSKPLSNFILYSLQLKYGFSTGLDNVMIITL